MANPGKSAQLQIRVSAAEKAVIQRAADRAGLGMSSYVLSRVLSMPAAQFQKAIESARADSRFGLAELNALLSGFTAKELQDAVEAAPAIRLSPFVSNYVTAMVEYACGRRSVSAPAWTALVQPLTEPAFGSNLESLRIHLLTNSPAPFRRRNIFIDSALGKQV